MSMRHCLTTWAALAAVFAPLPLAAQNERGYFRLPSIHGQTIVFTAEGDLWKGTIEGGFAQRLTTHPATESHAAISPDGKTLAFSAQYEGATEVYTMPIDGGVPVRRTFGGEPAWVCGWTRAGRVLYATERHSTLPSRQVAEFDLATGTRSLLPLAQASEGVFGGDDGRAFFFTRLPFQGSSTKRYRGGTAQNLWRFQPGDEEAVPLTADYPGTSKQPMWWKGRVYFLNDQDGIMNLWSMLPDGTDRQQLTRHPAWDIKSASLSEGRIVYAIGADLRLYDIASGEDKPLKFILPSDYDQQRDRWVKNPFEYVTSVHVSTNGDRVALTARGQVFVAPVQQGRFVEVTRNPSVRYRNARFLSGEHLIALGDQTGELEFAKLPANGVGAPQQITDTGKVFRFDGIPSPSGKWIAYYDKDYQLLLWNIAERKETLVATSDVGTIDELAWSPDGEWLAYVRPADNTFNQIFLYRPSSGDRIELTSDRTDSYSPAWSPDGKWLYFLSDREIRSLVSHPWGPRQPEPHFDQITRVYQVALKKGQRSPFRPRDELQKDDKKEEKKDEKKDPKKDEAKPADKKDENKSAVTVEIDRDGLAHRLEELPVPAGNYRNLAATAKNLYWTKRDTSFEGRTDLQQFEIKNDNPKPKTVVEGIRGFELSADGKKMLIGKGDAIYVQDADAGKLDEEKRVRLDGWTFAINPRDEWRQMFVESWRLMRDYFYDRKMHGVDWKAALDKYLPLVDRVTDRAELSDLMGDMVGELSALHIFVRNGDMREAPDRIQIASLGAELVRDEAAAGWRIRHIHRTDPDYPDDISPLLKPGVELEEGDVLLAFNGVSLFSVARPEMLLRNQAGRQVLVQYQRGEEKKEAIVVPIGSGQAANLRYSEWEYTRRKRVEELSNNQIGYVHLRAMGGANIAEWAREFYPVFQRQGLIIDVRHNRGGNIDSWILGKLLRKAWFYWQGRAGKPYWNMQYAFRGHLVVLCNEHTASDGEAFSEGFRRLGLGKVIGTRTWGGEIWLSFSNFLVDGGIASAAETGVYGPEGSWLIEGHGVEPDLVVDNLPHETFLGKDRQLEAAVAHLQELIETDPRPVPPVPDFPNKSHKIISATEKDAEAVAGR